MRDPWNDSQLVERIRAHERTAFKRAPLNAALAGAISRDRSLHTLLAHAPESQQYPVLLLAAIHYLVLAEPDHDLASWYPNVTVDHRDAADPALASTLHDFVNDRAPAVLELLATRRVQTNEIGRCALLLAGFDALAARVGRRPLAQVDVGTSAGLTTLLSRFRYRYDDHAIIGVDGPLIECSTRGDRPPPTSVPTMAAGRGIDLVPIDITEPDDARWLEACCWPDQKDRFERLVAAIEIARLDPPTLVTGDAIEVIRSVIDEVPGDQHPVVTSTWALNYLEPDDRRRFLAELDAAGAERDMSWVFAESPALTAELPHSEELAGEHTTELVVVDWRDGRRTATPLANCHPHGYWMHWS